jgi:putative DNA primase/helicase
MRITQNPSLPMAETHGHRAVATRHNDVAGDPLPMDHAQRKESYGAAALSRAVAAVTSTLQGARNHVLNREAYRIGRLVGGNVLEEAEARGELTDAAMAVGLSAAEARATIAGALRDGMRNPRLFPDSGMSVADREQAYRRARFARKQAEASQRHREAVAANKASSIWSECCSADPAHPYLKAKGVSPLSARQRGDRLVLPLTDLRSQRITSLQYIWPDGTKRLLPDGKKRGCVIYVAGDIEQAPRVLVAEGWATGATLSEMDPDALVLSAIDAGNLHPVATEVRRAWPDRGMVICADADPVGKAKGKEAAIAAGALIAVPEFPEGVEGSDWNDYVNAGLTESKEFNSNRNGEDLE